MNYIAEVNRFYDWLETNLLSTSAIVLWHALMNINNKCGWIKEFGVATSVLCAKTGLSDRTIRNARNELKQKGRIDWKTRGGNRSATYILFPLSVTIADTVSVITSDTLSDSTSDNASALNKLNYTKLNKEKSRKEKKQDYDFSLLPDEFIPIIEKWLKYKKERKDTPYKKIGFSALCKNILKLSDNDSIKAELIVEQSMANNWKGLFALKNNYENKNNRAVNTQANQERKAWLLDYAKGAVDKS